MRTLLATSLILSLFALALPAQESSKKTPAPPIAGGPALTGEDGIPVQGIRLARAEVKAVVHGNLAQATMVLTFANDLAQVLGGNLVFPLPQGATVTGYGLEVNGQIVDGVAVEKERARVIYETEIHKRVDPGLVEHLEGNAFRTRLYPIPARGTRSIRIEYATQIEQGMDGPTLALPLGFGDLLDELSIRLEAPEATDAPLVTRSGIKGLTFARAERGFVAAASVKKARSGDELVIVLPELVDRSVAVGKRAKFPRTIEELAGTHGIDHLPIAGSFESFEHYFVITDSPVEPARKSAALKSARVGVVWDASLSRADAEHGRELKLLESVLSRLGNPETDLIILRNEIEVRPFFAGSAGGAAKLIETIKGLPCDGGTSLGSLILPKNLADYRSVKLKESPGDYDFFLVFTDGFGNLGADRPALAKVPVYAICDDLQANHALLGSICQESGGSYFNLRGTTDDQVLAAIGQAPFRLISVDCKADEIAEVYPPIGTEVRGRLTVSGKLLAPQATLTLHYGFGQHETSSQTFTINGAEAEEGTMLPRFWAQQKVAALSLFPDKNAEELPRLGRQFNLVTPDTSLLVLETVDQYVQYRVVPPPTRPEIYRQFLAKIEEHRTQEARTREQKLQQVVAMWNARVAWWDLKFRYPANLKVNPEGARPDEVAAGSPPAAAPPPAGQRPGSPGRPVAGNATGDPAALAALIATARAEDLAREQANRRSDDLVRQGRNAQVVGRLLEAQEFYIQAVHENPLNPVAQAGLDEVLVAEGRSPTSAPALADMQNRIRVRASEITYRVQTAEDEARLAIADRRFDLAEAAMQRAELAATADRSIFPVETLLQFDQQIASTRLALRQRQENERQQAGRNRDADTGVRFEGLRSRALLERHGRVLQRWAPVPSIDVPGSIGVTSLNTASNNQLAVVLLPPVLVPRGLNDATSDVAVAIKPWDPQTPYIDAMKAVSADRVYDVYLAQRKNFAKSPAFYFDCADYLVKVGQRALGIRVLTDIVELQLHDARLLRVAAHRLNQIHERDLAIDLFEKILKLRPEEPQSYRDLALALADRGDQAVALAPVDLGTPAQEYVDRALADYVRSLELLNKVVLGDWPRFPEIELPVLMEANDIAAKAQRLPGVHDFHNLLDSRLQKNLDLDVRVVMTWDADQTDVDLWVTEPSGEKCYYSHNRTLIGGLLSHDFTDGYGPEEYCLRKLMPGQYVIEANFYGSRQQELTGPATVQATVITNFGRPGEKRQAMTLRLKAVQQVVDVGTITLDGKDPK